jgi:phosphate transport system substrate-binding protein
MNAKTHRVAIATGILALIASCTATSETSNSSQQSQNLTQVSDAQITTVSTVKVDGSSTVYPITKAVCSVNSSQTKGEKLCRFLY